MTTVLHGYTLSECMELAAKYAAAYESMGQKNIIFCEDRLTLIAERAILQSTGGSFSTSVNTFARFLKTDEKILSKQGGVMAVGEIMASLQQKGLLKCFTSPAGIKNNAKCVYETIAQISASEVTPDTLEESLCLLTQEDSTLKDKISDLKQIYAAYLDFLREENYLDENKYLALLPKCILESDKIAESNVFFLCFSSFTSQGKEAIRAAISRAKNVVGIFVSGKEGIYTNRAEKHFLSVAEEFGKVRTVDAGIPLENEAEVLRRGLFAPERLKSEKYKTDKIEVYEAEDKSGEADYVASKIKKLLFENANLRYRDIAVLLSNASAYALPLKKSFEEYGIPYFFDEKKSLKNHPLGRFLLACLAAVREGYSPESVQTVASNYFFGRADEYRNYLLKFAAYRGGAKKPIKSGSVVEGYDVPALEAARERLLKATDFPKKATGGEYCRAVKKLLIEFDTQNRLKELEEETEDVALKGYLSQIDAALERLLTEAETLMGEAKMTVAEFEAVLSDGLEAAEISLIPLKSDAVFVGDVTDSKIEKVAVLFAVGMTDEVPRRSEDTALISDREIERLKDVKTLLEPTVAEVNLRSRESVSLNLCTFTDRLFLSYPLAADGSEPQLSEIFRYVFGLFSEKSGRGITPKKGNEGFEFPFRCSAPVPAIRELLLKKNTFERGKGDTRKEYSSLFAALESLSVSEKDDYLKEWNGQIRISCGEELFFKNGKLSPTALEGYFACPFCNFASRGLRLARREETAVMATDYGNFMHELLEKISPRLKDFASETEACVYARSVGEELLKKPVYAAGRDTAAGEYSAGTLLSEAEKVVKAVFRGIKDSGYEVEETEKPVSTDAFHGKIDRVDGSERYVRIIDYKTGAIDDSPVSYYTGRRLQLELYMSAVQGNRIPAGVFYFPASASYSESAEGKFRMKGFLNGEKDALLVGDKNLTEEAKSEFFDARLDHNDRLEKVMDEETFRDFLDYAVLEAKQGAKELKGGFIAPTPYKGECTYCKYGGMCGFNYDRTGERTEEKISPKTIAAIAKQAKEGTK